MCTGRRLGRCNFEIRRILRTPSARQKSYSFLSTPRVREPLNHQVPAVVKRQLLSSLGKGPSRSKIFGEATRLFDEPAAAPVQYRRYGLSSRSASTVRPL